MKINSKLINFFLIALIFSSLFVLIAASYKQIQRNKTQNSLTDFSKDYYNLAEELDYPYETRNDISLNDSHKTIDKTENIYSTTENPQKKWLNKNEDYEGWLVVEGTKINYPVVKSTDNNFYLDRDFEKEKNELGSIFMDYKNIGSFNDKHTTIYGHYTKTGVMLGDLHKYKDEEFSKLNNSISFDSLYSKKEFEIFSVYIDSADNYELKFNFENEKEYYDYLTMISEKSMHNLEGKIDKDKLLLTLATCSYELGNGRLIIHAIEKTD